MKNDWSDSVLEEAEVSNSAALVNLRKAIGARLRAHRIHRNMTGIALARGAGISGAMLSKIEASERMPSVPVLAALAEVLGVEIGDLFGSTASTMEPLLTRASSPGAGAPPHDPKHIWIEQLGVMEMPDVQIRLLRLRARKGCRPTKPVQFDGFWIDQVVSGEAVVCIGERDYHLFPGDTLSYRGEVPHYMKAFPAGACEVLAVQGWINTNSTRRIKLDGALLSPGVR